MSARLLYAVARLSKSSRSRARAIARSSDPMPFSTSPSDTYAMPSVLSSSVSALRLPAAIATSSAASPSLAAWRKRPRRNRVRASQASSSGRCPPGSSSGSIASARSAISSDSSPRFSDAVIRACSASRPA